MYQIFLDFWQEDAKYPWEGVPIILQSDGVSSFPEGLGVLDFLGKIARRCQISGAAKLAVTPHKIVSAKSALLHD